MNSITLYEVDNLPVNTQVYLVEKMSVTIYNQYTDTTIHGDVREHPVLKFLKRSDGNLVPEDNYPIEIIDSGDGTPSSPIEDPKYKVFLTERDALTWYYKSLLEFQENIQRFSKSIDSFANAIKNTQYMVDHINSYPEDFI